MSKIFPKIIENLPEANIHLNNAKAYLSQGDNHQIIFLEFKKDTYIPEHSHNEQWEYVLDGKVDLYINNSKKTYIQGDNFLISKGIKHSAKIYAGYKSIAFFNQKDRYHKK